MASPGAAGAPADAGLPAVAATDLARAVPPVNSRGPAAAIFWLNDCRFQCICKGLPGRSGGREMTNRDQPGGAGAFSMDAGRARAHPAGRCGRRGLAVPRPGPAMRFEGRRELTAIARLRSPDRRMARRPAGRCRLPAAGPTWSGPSPPSWPHPPPSAATTCSAACVFSPGSTTSKTSCWWTPRPAMLLRLGSLPDIPTRVPAGGTPGPGRPAAGVPRPAPRPLSDIPHSSTVAPLFDEAGRGQQPLGCLVLVNGDSASSFPCSRCGRPRARTAETLMVRRDGDHALFLAATPPTGRTRPSTCACRWATTGRLGAGGAGAHRLRARRLPGVEVAAVAPAHRQHPADGGQDRPGRGLRRLAAAFRPACWRSDPGRAGRHRRGALATAGEGPLPGALPAEAATGPPWNTAARSSRRWATG